MIINLSMSLVFSLVSCGSAGSECCIAMESVNYILHFFFYFILSIHLYITPRLSRLLWMNTRRRLTIWPQLLNRSSRKLHQTLAKSKTEKYVMPLWGWIEWDVSLLQILLFWVLFRILYFSKNYFKYGHWQIAESQNQHIDSGLKATLKNQIKRSNFAPEMICLYV